MLLSELSYDYGGRRRIVLTGKLVVDLKLGLKGFHFLGDTGVPWAHLADDIMTVRAGYACDGCSPAIRIFGKWIGTPTPKETVAACVVHDVLRGYHKLQCMHVTLQQTDEVFFNLLRESGFDHAGIYHGAVAGPLGRLYYALTAARPSHARCRYHL